MIGTKLLKKEKKTPIDADLLKYISASSNVGLINMCFIDVTYAFRGNQHSEVAWMSRNYLLETVPVSENLSDYKGTRTHNDLVS